MACLCKVEDEDYLIKKVLEVMEGMKDEERKDYLMKVLTLTELRPNIRIRVCEEVRHMPIVVRPEDIRISKKNLKKDLLYSLGLEEGKQIGIEEGLLIAQDMVLTAIRSKLGYVPEGVEDRVRNLKDRRQLSSLMEKLITSSDVLQTLKEELRF